MYCVCEVCHVSVFGVVWGVFCGVVDPLCRFRCVRDNKTQVADEDDVFFPAVSVDIMTVCEVYANKQFDPWIDACLCRKYV